MPIRPENRHRYPKDWKAIRARILERARHRCEWCGVKNYDEGYRYADGTFRTMRQIIANGDADDDSIRLRYVRIVLTIMHLHPPIEDCSDENLKAACQRCHNRYDAASRHAGIIARKRSQNRSLFVE